MRRWVKISDEVFKRCLREADLREELRAKQSTLVAEDLALTHNADKKGMLPVVTSGSQFVRVARTSELPIQFLAFVDDKSHIGKRYVISGIVGWSDDDGEGTIWIYGTDAGVDERGFLRDSTMVRADALNSYHREFLSRHCWTTMPGESTSFCEGQIYIEIKSRPGSDFIAAQLVGAEFKDARSDVLLDAWRRTADVAAKRSTRK